ncbi:hypothetical protein BGZ61DRAFT_354878 [Ilyonectria robusta]|uniref:uncharacterized protein n=1 Tax=Ilyonectria robusta TaxID=1079257 RepID=UPI001E8D9DE9|nr:uncharacterized protein BGZ61DRAFT_354878 [Ilyonectria robusta]KAH8686772.1 hypothetical protein BGZ61DRAFT_354878 [Ilyonectria robusta]
MSMLATASPSPHPAFGMPRPWEVTRCPDYSLRPRMENDGVALPSIRQAFPELQLQPQPQAAVAKPGSTVSHSPAPPMSATSPKYIHSPNETKRRRLSIEADQEYERARQVPRHYYSPERSSSRQISPSLPMQSTQESWGAPSRPSSFMTNGALPAPAHLEMKDRADPRNSLPSLPPPRTMEREPASASRLPTPVESYRSSQQPPIPPHSAAPIPESAPSPYREPGYGYSYHHPTRYQSLSAGSAHSFERTPFTAGGYNTPYPEYGRYGEMGPISLTGDNKQRKRRGNLPKETTDKLRAWFVAHLQHPYPTEDEKQDLMRQTGLQMNQISNWFINARRRQLPTMINNARAESDAMTGARGGDIKVLATTERGDFDHSKREPAAGPLSDGEGATYDEDLEVIKQHRGANMSRGSV